MTATETEEPVVLQRSAKGPKPRYFADPATDKLLTMVLELMQELSVARDRIDTLERLLDAAGVISRSDVETYLPDRAVNAERAARRGVMLSRVFRASEKELELILAKGKDLELEEINRALD